MRILVFNPRHGENEMNRAKQRMYGSDSLLIAGSSATENAPSKGPRKRYFPERRDHVSPELFPPISARDAECTPFYKCCHPNWRLRAFQKSTYDIPPHHHHHVPRAPSKRTPPDSPTATTAYNTNSSIHHMDLNANPYDSQPVTDLPETSPGGARPVEESVEANPTAN
ncbi:hypothetical protein H4Q26_013412, partial [Puccinia striiformis f. sp. tritici PST-130]